MVIKFNNRTMQIKALEHILKVNQELIRIQKAFPNQDIKIFKKMLSLKCNVDDSVNKQIKDFIKNSVKG